MGNRDIQADGKRVDDRVAAQNALLEAMDAYEVALKVWIKSLADDVPKAGPFLEQRLAKPLAGARSLVHTIADAAYRTMVR